MRSSLPVSVFKSHKPFVAHVFCLVVAACSVSIKLPADALVQCANDGECGSGLACAEVTGLCARSDDERAPILLSAEVIDATTVVLHFDEEVYRRGEVFEVVPPLVIAASERVDAMTISLRTAPMLAGEPYVLSVAGVFDRRGNAAAGGASFLGFGLAPNRSAPALVSPAEEETTYGETVLAWTALPGDRTYRVEVSTNADFTHPVMVVDTKRSSVPFIPETDVAHYWRVRGDTTAAGVFARSTFHAVLDTLYVACAADPCVGGSGDRTVPMRSVAGALQAAVSHDLHLVLVAARPGALAYDEAISLPVGVLLRGGYDESFTTQTGFSKISTLGQRGVTAVSARGITDRQTELSHFDVTADGSGLAMLVMRSDAALTISDNELRTANSNVPTRAVLLEQNGTSVDTAPAFVRNVVVAGANAGTGVGANVALRVSGGYVRLDHNTIVGGATTVSTSDGVFLDNVVGARLFRNTIRGGNATGSAAPGVLETSVGLRAWGASGALDADANVISAGAVHGGQTYGAWVHSVNARMTNNEMTGGTRLPSGSVASYGLQMSGAQPATFVVNNVIAVPDSNGAGVIDYIQAAYANNVFHSVGPRCIYAAKRSSQASYFSLHNNAFVGCATAVEYLSPNQLISASAVNDASAYMDSSPARPATSVTGNVAFATLQDADAAIQFLGLDALSSTCGDTAGKPCNGRATDALGLTRTCVSASACFSMGTHERD